MNSNNENSKDARSKIEEIRIDLEKKLAALEAIKLKALQKVSENETKKEKLLKDTNIEKNQSFIENISKIENSSALKKTNTTEVDKTIEEIKILEDTKPVEKTNIVNEVVESKEVPLVEKVTKKTSNQTNVEKKIKSVEEVNLSKEINIAQTEDVINKFENVETDFPNEDTLFEINDTIEKVVDNEIIIEKVTNNKIINSNDAIIDSTPSPTGAQIKTETKNDIKPIKNQNGVKEVAIGLTKTSNKIDNEKEEVEKEDNESKKSKLNYAIYAFGGFIFLSLVYLSWTFLNKNMSSNDDEIFSEYENRRYKDSIELADANNLISDFQSQRYIDSIALVNQIQIENNEVDKATSSKKKTDKSNAKNKNKKPKPKLKTPEPVENNFITNPFIADNKITFDNNTTPIKNKEEVEKKPEKEEVAEKIVKTEEKKELKVETLTTIEKSPVYPGCEGKKTESLKKKCLMSSISKFVAKKFNSDLSQDLGLEEGRKRIKVSFLIDKSGNVTVLKVRAQHKVLEKEALRVVNSLPKMKPGKKNGKTKPVLYNLPIVYSVNY